MSSAVNLDDFYWVEIAPGRLRLMHPSKERHSKPSDATHVIIDTMNPLIHPITQKMMDSKSEFRKVTRAHGCEEVGNEKMVDRRDFSLPDARPDLGRALDQLNFRE